MRRRRPNLPTDYFDAMERHWEDAELLWNHEPKRFANADQLYGLVTECGLKAIMGVLDNNFFDNNLQMPSNPEHKVHADRICSVYTAFLQGGHAARYALPFNTNPFEQWEIDDRYANREHFNHARVYGHRGAALQVKDLVDEAKRQQELP